MPDVMKLLHIKAAARTLNRSAIVMFIMSLLSARRLQKTRKIVQLRWEDCVKRDLRFCKKGRGGRKVERKRPTTGSNGKNNESSHTADRQLTSGTSLTSTLKGKREEEQESERWQFPGCG